MAEDSVGDIWISAHEFLCHLRNGNLIEQIPWARLGTQGFAKSVLADPVRGGLWLGFFNGGVTYFKDGQVRASYPSVGGSGEGRVNSLQIDRDGALWAATTGGLGRLKDGHIATLTHSKGLPCDSLDWVLEDDARSFWLNMACGLVRITRTDIDAWVKDSERIVQVTVFDSSDGVRSHAFYGNASPHVAKSSDGKLWFSTWDGLSVVDPQHLPANKLRPPVHVEQVIANGKTYWRNLTGDATSELRLPPRVRDLEIDYTALSFVAPEKNRFKYKLEGYDREWRDLGNRRQAYYGNLSPRNYRFRVIASNNSGVWNEAGDTLDFSIDPAYYQTSWFRALCVAASLGVLYLLYLMRVRQLAREFNAHLEGRIDERLRVARDLHDTLLQSFQGLIPVFQTARTLLPARADRAAEVLDDGLKEARHAIVEGRNSIQNLRANPSADLDLSSLLTAAGHELTHSPEANSDTPAFRVLVEGSRRPLAPLVQDEIYGIAREALRNAFQHAHAEEVEVEVRYDRSIFRLRIRDDGMGIDSSVLQAGARPGHWGLPGMVERAKGMGGRLKIWSEAGAGAEIELTVPARVAYAKLRQ